MGFKAKELPSTGGGNFTRKIIDPGAYDARLVGLLILGIQKQRPYKGQDKPPVLEMSATYELLDEYMLDEDGNDIEDKPCWLSETFPFYSLDVDRAVSTKRYYALDPKDEKDGDWVELLGTPCTVSVVHGENKKDKDKPYVNISNVSAMNPKKAAKAPDLVNETRVFDFYEPDMEVFWKLPKWIQDKMKDAVDFEGSALEQAIEDNPKPDDDDDKKAAAKPAAKTTAKKASKAVEADDEDEGDEDDDHEGY